MKNISELHWNICLLYTDLIKNIYENLHLVLDSTTNLYDLDQTAGNDDYNNVINNMYGIIQEITGVNLYYNSDVDTVLIKVSTGINLIKDKLNVIFNKFKNYINNQLIVQSFFWKNRWIYDHELMTSLVVYFIIFSKYCVSYRRNI